MAWNLYHQKKNWFSRPLSHLVYKDHSTQPSPSSRCVITWKSTILSNDDHANVHPLTASSLQCNAKGQPVPSVVVDNHKRTGWALNGSQSSQDGGWGRRGEHRAIHSRCIHVSTNIAPESRLMTTPSSTKESHLSPAERREHESSLSLHP